MATRLGRGSRLDSAVDRGSATSDVAVSDQLLAQSSTATHRCQLMGDDAGDAPLADRRAGRKQ